MQPEQINASLQALVRQFPAIHPLPYLPDALVKRQTFLGFTFTEKESISSKCYFRPERDLQRLLSIIPARFHQQFRILHDRAARQEAALYDCSLECTEEGGETARAVWSIPHAARQDSIRLEAWLSEFLSSIDFEHMLQPFLIINTALQKGTGSSLAPLYLAGGYIHPDKGISRLKISFDADCVDPDSPNDRKPCYDPARILAGLSHVLPLAASPQQTNIVMDYARRLLRTGYQIHLWGLHAQPHCVEEFKIYFQRKNAPISHEDNSILQEIMATYKLPYTELPQAISQILTHDGWSYWGFNMGLRAGRPAAIKLYFTA